MLIDESESGHRGRNFIWSRVVAAGIASAIALAGTPAPAHSGMGLQGGVASSARAGGLLVDYREFMRKVPRDAVDVTLARDGVLIRYGGKEHVVELTGGELAELLTVAITPPHLYYFEVSVDRSRADQRAVVIHDELQGEHGPLNIGQRLVEADFAFADLVQGGEWSEDEAVREVAPVLHQLRLLEDDSAYGALTRDLVAPPTTWPMIKFTVRDLARDEPVEVAAEMGLSFVHPDGMTVAADGKVITPEMVRQAERPYEPLRAAIRDPQRQDALFERFPALALAEKYALVSAALGAYCRDHLDVCTFAQQELGLPPAEPFELQPKEKAVMAAIALGELAVEGMWSKRRRELAEGLVDREQRRAMFLDEANYSMTAGRRWNEHELLQLASRGRPADRETSLATDLYRALVKVRSAHSVWALNRALRKLDRAVTAIETSGLPEDRREFWLEKASNHLLQIRGVLADKALELKFPRKLRITFRHGEAGGRVARAEYVKTVSERLVKVAEGNLTRCVKEVGALADSAIKDPHAVTEQALREALVRSDRCKLGEVAGKNAGLFVEGALHYAIGIQAAGDELRQSEALDRLRMLRSLADMTDDLKVFLGLVELAEQLGGATAA